VAPTLAAGALVRFHGLRYRLDLHCLLAQCITFTRQSKRWGVRVLDNDDDEQIAVKACNLQFLSGTVASDTDLLRFWTSCANSQALQTSLHMLLSLRQLIRENGPLTYSVPVLNNPFHLGSFTLRTMVSG
jgi:hypothetical protein